MAKLITIYWRDIPSQIVAKAGRRSAKVRLANRFQEAIDRAAMRAERAAVMLILVNGAATRDIAVMISKPRRRPLRTV